MIFLSFRSLSIGLLFFAIGCNTPVYFTKNIPPEEVPTRASLLNGEQLFKKHCVRCHGERGKGDGPEASKLKKPPANLVKQGIHFSVMNMALIVEAPYHSKLTMGLNITEGKKKMPAWKDTLSPEEINDITNFVKYLQLSTENPQAE